MPLVPRRVRALAGWSKATAFSAIALLISLGLCGLNYGAFVVFNLPIEGGGVPGQQTREHVAGVLVLTAFAETAAILASAAALIVSSIGLLLESLSRGREQH